MIKQEVLKHIDTNKIFTVIKNNSDYAPYDIAMALIEGGLTTIEISVDVPNALQVVEKLKKENILLGACSVITAQQVQHFIQAGAQFIDTPVMELSVIRFSKGDAKVPIIIGASTVNEAYQTWKLNTLFTKIFPTKELGGTKYVSYIAKLMPFLRIIASSGICEDDFTEYLDAGATAVGLGRRVYADAVSLKEITIRAKIIRKRLDDYLASKA